MRNLTWGIKWGLFGGSVVAVIASVILLLKGGVDLGVNPVLVVLAYPVAGLLAGVLAGILRPLLTSRRSSSLLGAMIGIPTISVLMPLVIGSPSDWDIGEVIGVMITGGLLGGIAGFKWWELADFDPVSVHPRDHKRAENQESRSRRGKHHDRKGF